MRQAFFTRLTPTADGLALGAGMTILGFGGDSERSRLISSSDPAKAARCLVQAQNRLRALSPLDILKIEGLLPKHATTLFDKDYNPDEPRDAQGRWTGDGEDDSGSDGAAPDRSEESSLTESTKTRQECLALCSNLALPTQSGDGAEFYRCVNHCMGINYWPQWAPFLLRVIYYIR